MKRTTRIPCLLLSILLCANTAMPCTTFVLKGNGRIYFGRNLDWFWPDGLVVVNQRQVRKTAFLTTDGTPAKWTSRFGSVTFNQFGREMPFGGMNEAGLVVENMVLTETRYAAPDARPAVNLLQWIQYQLDNSGTVAEVIAAQENLRIEMPPPSTRGLALIHYLVCDATGDSATFEYLDGKMVVHRGANLPCPVLANSTYDASTAYLQAHPQPAKPAAKAENLSSLSRFAHAAARAAAYSPSQPRQEIDYAFDTLDQVRQGDFTVWTIVYDVTARQIHYRTRGNPQERTLDLKSLDFSTAHPVQFLDIEAKPDASGLMPFATLTEARHREYLDALFKRDSVKKEMGDLTLLEEGLLFTLRGYTPVPNPTTTSTEPAPAPKTP